MDINETFALIQLLGIVLMIVAYRYQEKKQKIAVEKALEDLHKIRYEHEGAIVLLNKGREEYKKALAKVEAQPNIDMENISKFMEEYQDLHELMKQTLHDEAYEHVLATNPQEAELVFTWILKKGYTVMNTSTKKESILMIMDGVDVMISGTIKDIYNERIKGEI